MIKFCDDIPDVVHEVVGLGINLGVLNINKIIKIYKYFKNVWFKKKNCFGQYFSNWVIIVNFLHYMHTKKFAKFAFRK